MNGDSIQEEIKRKLKSGKAASFRCESYNFQFSIQKYKV